MAGFPAKKNTAFTFWTALTDAAETTLFKANPTLASGDVQVSIDGGAFANLATLPDAEPVASASIRIQLTASEMNGDMIVVKFSDASGDEWCDQMVVIQTDVATIGEIEAQTDDIGVGGAGLTALGDARLANLDATISSRGTADPGDAMTLDATAVDAVLDEVVEGTLTMRQVLRLLNSFIGAKVTGGGTATITFRDVGDSKPRITMTVDPLTGDRSAVVLDGA